MCSLRLILSFISLALVAQILACDLHSSQFLTLGPFETSCYCRAELNWSNFDFSTAVARRLRPSRASASAV